MRIEKLNSNKIKVTLTTMDLVNLNIDVEQLAPDSKELHSFLFHIMETIKEETGFNPYNGQVIVEATPSREGISILVSKIACESKKISKEKFNKAKGVTVKLREAYGSRIFYFNSFDDMCMALTEVSAEFLMNSCLYQLNSTYCFINQNDIKNSVCSSVMADFSVKSSDRSLQSTYIKEHGKLIAKGNELVLMSKEIRTLL